jgi:16S rRNA (guanine966-N2)-methyltransferase
VTPQQRPALPAPQTTTPGERNARTGGKQEPLTSNARPPGQVRIIGGQWKRSVLHVPQHPGLRPTPDRVRETLFNWLGQDLSGWRVLDAFAGSGALGFEAASRGAARALLIEREPHLARQLEAAQQRLAATTVQVLCTDALRWMQRQAALAAADRAGAVATPVAGSGTPNGEAFELILLDPPFDAGMAPQAVQAALPLLVPMGWLYVESPLPLMALPEGLQAVRALKAGAVHAQLLRRAP